MVHKQDVFQALKRALGQGPVLQMPNFDNHYIVEWDTSESGFDTVLHQGTGHLAFLSRPIAALNAKLAAYGQEHIELVKVVRHWRT